MIMIEYKSECTCCKHVRICKYESQHQRFEEELTKLQEAFGDQKTDWFNAMTVKHFCKHFDAITGFKAYHCAGTYVPCTENPV